jgi:hypothetical protein
MNRTLESCLKTIQVGARSLGWEAELSFISFSQPDSDPSTCLAVHRHLSFWSRQRRGCYLQGAQTNCQSIQLAETSLQNSEDVANAFKSSIFSPQHTFYCTAPPTTSSEKEEVEQKLQNSYIAQKLDHILLFYFLHSKLID